MKSYYRYFYSFGVATYAISQWSVILLASKIFELSLVGDFSLYLAIISTITILLNFGLRNYISSDIEEEFSKDDYYSLKVLMLCINSLILIFFAFLVSSPLMFFIISVAKIFESLSDPLYGLWIKENHAYRYGVSQLIKLVAFIVLSVVTSTSLPQSLEYYSILSYPLSVMLGFFLYDVKYLKVKININLERVKMIAKKTYSLSIVSFLISFYILIPRFYLRENLGGDSVAIFTYISYYWLIFTLGVTSILQVMIPHLSLSKEKIKKIKFHRKNIFFISLVCLFYFFFMLVYSNLITELLYGHQGVEFNVRIVSGFLGVVLVFNAYLNTCLIALKSGKVLMRVNFFSVILLLFGLFFMDFISIVSIFNVLVFLLFIYVIQFIIFFAFIFNGGRFGSENF